MPFPLETERFLQRHFCDSDLDVFLEYRSDTEVARYQGWAVPYKRNTGRAFIEEMKNANPGMPGKWFQAAIEKKSSKTVLGDCAFHVMKNNRRQAYIGITLERPYWGKGYANEVSRRLIEYLFSELNLHRIVAECYVDNAASFILLEPLGFRREAELVENVWFKGAWGSEYHYAMLER